MEGDRTVSTPSSVGLSISEDAQRLRALHGRTTGPTRRSTKGQWTAEEDEILRDAVQRFKGKNWKKIAECFKDRTDVQCLHRWQKVLNPELVKGPWSKEEDELIVELVNKYGPKKWSTIAQHLPGRIGKQCRERWHNHLNPAINRQAWTQEEELALIRAHQIFGNRWAELSKFLPGRTDNAIKNHWNSSIKKKLDSYIASGLLEQFQFPILANQSQPMPSSYSTIQSNADDSASKVRTEAEDISECSQETAMVSCSQSTSDLANAAVHTREQFHFTEMPGVVKVENPSPALCSEEYYPSLEDVNFSIPEIPSEVYFASGDNQFGLPDLPNISSLDLGQESSGPNNCLDTSESHEVMDVTFPSSVGLNAPTPFINMVTSTVKQEQMLIPDDECCSVLFSKAVNDGCFASENFTRGSNMVEMGGFTNALLSEASDIQISEMGRIPALQSNCPSRSELLPTSCCQSFVSPSLLSAEDGIHMIGGEPCQLNTQPFGNQEQAFTMNAHDGFIYTSDDHTDNIGLQGKSYLDKDSRKLVPVNTFGLESNVVETCSSVEDKPTLPAEQDVGGLCYEPPRFPSLDIPFFSCDLIPSGCDMQQEYSPLGIRQLMMSTTNCISPFRLWDSPSGDNSPDAQLKSAAKTFTGTPSILKKRHRDLLSPLSERRSEKKLETYMTSNLTKDFSCLDVIFNESGTGNTSQDCPSEHKTNSSVSIEEKENLYQAFDEEHRNGGDHTESLNDEAQKNDSNGTSSLGHIQKEASETHTKDKTEIDASYKIVRRPAAVLVERNLNDPLLFSPDHVGPKTDRSLLSSSMRTPRNRYHSGNACIVVSSPTLKIKKSEGNSIAADTTVQCTDSLATLENLVDNTGNNIFGDTPFKRSIESPSAWKSPWFINSFVPGPRIDTDITIEDMGYLMSPVERSYDAIGLMKQLSEHTAAAYADALEVLGNETPESIMKGRAINNPNNMDKENSHSHLAPNVLAERRILDFSGCGTPGKGSENGKSSTGMSFSSSSSHLLKGLR
ncbi:C-MYB-LIKE TRANSCRIPTION FACTOR 3R-1, MYB DOMAIN PROTEIN 3R1, A. thaliana MYB domain protein 3R1 [Hibiscus trionum]|uniref:C-MYB-LIKE TRANSCRIPTION FACTOR 3R-1, MYB DOMAIN PROTEIN 3R1, A. thaliana MYB domain protein 3R1 n=1 Tax=Hibiscus trionum TaxID=183268 RepID=A0A9W7HQQ0_HIBTR|nr:C-MYB-LIKE TRANSCRIPTION FACTOR 3R-1, MYB DOMAIN PROTEIN 3R1, A. thaliana MYB domain protein 3R1 [Hibiscus trionum]